MKEIISLDDYSCLYVMASTDCWLIVSGEILHVWDTSQGRRHVGSRSAISVWFLTTELRCYTYDIPNMSATMITRAARAATTNVNEKLIWVAHAPCITGYMCWRCIVAPLGTLASLWPTHLSWLSTFPFWYWIPLYWCNVKSRINTETPNAWYTGARICHVIFDIQHFYHS